MATWPNVNNTNLSTQEDEYILLQNGINYVQNTGTLAGAIDQGEWVPTFDYELNTVVRGADKRRYISIQESGPNKGGSQDPVSTPLYWLDCTDIFKTRQATQQEVTDGADVDAYVPPDLLQQKIKQGIDGPAISGSATFTNTDNNIALTGIGSLKDLEIGDVLQVSGSTSNDTEYTVEVITDSDNVIVNQAHAGGTTSKALTDETSTVTVKLLTKWHEAPITLGQGWVNVTASRSSGTPVANNTGRAIKCKVSGLPSNTGVRVELLINNLIVANGTFSDPSVNGYKAVIGDVIPRYADYEVFIADGIDIWSELR